jgi:WD40 repeat protein
MILERLSLNCKLLALILLTIFLAACDPNAQSNAVLVGGATITPTPILLSESVEPITRENIARAESLGELVRVDPLTTVFAYDVSPDGTRLAGLNNELLLSWDLVNGTLVFSTARLNATRVFYSPDKIEIYTVADDGTVNVTNDRGAFQTSFMGNAAYNFNALAYYKDEGWLAVGGRDGTVKVWDTAGRVSMATIQAQTLSVNSVAFSPDGTLLASGGDEGTVGIWEWETRTLVHRIEVGTPPSRLAFSPDGTQLAVATLNDIRLYNVGDAAQTAVLFTGERGSSEVMMYAPNGDFLVNGGGIPNMQVWNPRTGELVALIPDFGNSRLSVDFSPDSTMLLTSMNNGETALWDMTQITDETINRGTLSVGVTTILFAEWTDDSRLMVFVDALGPIYVWGISPRGATPTQTPAS